MDHRALNSACKEVMRKSNSQYMQMSLNTSAMTAEKDKVRFAQERHLGSNYIPRKGKSREKYVDAMVSNLGSIFNMELDSSRAQTAHKRINTNWNEGLSGASKTPAPMPQIQSKSHKKPSAQSY